MSKLAVFGGAPSAKIDPPDWPIHDETERDALLEVLDSGQWWYGEKVREFEEAYAAYQDAKYGVTCVNGTAAIEVACIAAGIGAGDEVITTPYTFIATASAPICANAVPIFVDLEEDTVNIDPDKIEEAITPRTKGIIPVHFGGLPCDMDKINRIAKKHDLVVIEDAAHCWGTQWKGKGAGALGDMGTFSFQQTKNMTSAEGGIILSDNEELADLARSFTNCGRSKTGKWYEHFLVGSNLRLTEFQAALLLAQLKRMPEHVAAREKNAGILLEGLRDIDGLRTLPRDDRVTRRAWHMFDFFFEEEAFDGVTRAQFLKALDAEGIPCWSGYIWPLYRNPLFQRKLEGAKGCPMTCPYREADPPDYSALYLPNAEKAIQTYCALDHSVLLGTEQEMRSIIDTFRKVRENAAELRGLKIDE